MAHDKIPSVIYETSQIIDSDSFSNIKFNILLGSHIVERRIRCKSSQLSTNGINIWENAYWLPTTLLYKL